ncbi:MAG: Prokaryotic lipoprotein-attachment site [Pseudomonadota bacterium]
MISKTDNHQRARIVAMLTLAVWVAGCGYKGPLYLPAKPAEIRPYTTPFSMYGVIPDEQDMVVPFFDEDLMLIPTPVVIE